MPKSSRIRLPAARCHRGVTLIELMVALAVLAILATIAAPSFREVLLNNRSSRTVNDLLADLALARSEAVKLAATVTVATPGGSWSEGWEVFIDEDADGVRQDAETLLKEVGPINDRDVSGNMFRLTGYAGAGAGTDASDFVMFGNLGHSRDPADGARFGLCRPDGDAARSTGIRVDVSGRAHSVKNLTSLGLGC
jgi:type IV fimbrial biogenesis protein FimT